MFGAKKRVLTLVIVLSLLMVLFPACGTIPLTGPLILVMPTSVKQGGTITVTGQNFTPVENLDITIDGANLTSVSADKNGNFKAEGLVVSVAPRKTATITAKSARRSGKINAATATIEVTAP